METGMERTGHRARIAADIRCARSIRRWHGIRWMAACLGGVLTLAVAAGIAANPGPARGEWFVTATAVHFDTPTIYDFGPAWGGAVGLGYAFTDSVALEAAYLEWDATRGDGRSRQISALWSPWAGRGALRPFLLAGGGNATNEPDADWPSGRCGQWFAGAGLYGSLGHRLHWRGDLRWVYSSGSSGLKPHIQFGLVLTVGPRASSSP